MSENVQIVEILEREGRKAKIRVLGGAFHPSGGGQPGDSGRLKDEGFEAEVLDCRNNGKGYILDIVVGEGEIPVGRQVEAAVDFERNRRFSRMHTGEHILSRTLENQLPGLAVQKVSIGEKESAAFMTYPGDIGWDDLFRAEDAANEIIAEDLPIGIKKVSKEKAGDFQGVKIKWDRIDEKEVTIVTIGEFDRMACSGTHVGSTSEVGGLIVTGFKGGNGEWEVKFTVDRQEALQRHSRITRVLSREIGCEEVELPSVVARLREDRKEATRKLDKVRRYLEIPWEDIGGTPGKIFFFAIENFPLELASAGVKKKIEKEAGCVVGFLSPDQNGGAMFILAAGKDLKVDLKGLLAEAEALKAKGGGAADWVQGRAGNGSPSEWKRALLSIVDK